MSKDRTQVLEEYKKLLKDREQAKNAPFLTLEGLIFKMKGLFQLGIQIKNLEDSLNLSPEEKMDIMKELGLISYI